MVYIKYRKLRYLTQQTCHILAGKLKSFPGSSLKPSCNLNIAFGLLSTFYHNIKEIWTLTPLHGQIFLLTLFHPKISVNVSMFMLIAYLKNCLFHSLSNYRCYAIEAKYRPKSGSNALYYFTTIHEWNNCT